jgi:AsmA protein
MKLVRIFFMMFALLIALIAAAFTYLLLFFDPNSFKPVIEQQVKKSTGYQLVIEGPMSWTLYPRVGVKIERMTLRAPNQAKPFADLHGVNIAADLKQLLHGYQKLRGDIRIANVLFMNMNMQRAYVGLHWQGDALTLQPVRAALYEGNLKGVANAHHLTSMPHWQWNAELRNVQLKPLLIDVNGPQSKLKVSGVGDVTCSASTDGMSRQQLLSNLNGVVDFGLKNGVVEGLDLNYLVQTANNLLNDKPITLPQHLEQTTFQRLSGTAKIKNGVANIDNLLLASDAFTTKGEGAINLLNETLNLQLIVSPLNQDKVHWDVPVLITGNLQHPAVSVDARALQAIFVKEKLQDVKTKVKEKVQDELKKLPDDANKFFQKILGQ